MTAKEFPESKGFDDLREGLYHVFEQDEIELLLNEGFPQRYHVAVKAATTVMELQNASYAAG